jgi:hypothetical protein
MSHPDPSQLERFIRGDLPRPEVLVVVRHLLRGCPQCAVLAQRFWHLGRRPLALVILLQEASELESVVASSWRTYR